MLQNTLLARWRKWFGAVLPRVRKTGRRPTSFLRLEALEDRCVPTAPLGPPNFHFQYVWTGSAQQTIQPPAGDYFHKGDKVVIEANVEEDQDSDSGSDGDPGLSLLVTSPGQTDAEIPANLYDFGAAVFTYQGVAFDNAPIYAEIQHGDGDETGTVNVDDYPGVARIDINNTQDRKDNIVLYDAASSPFGQRFSQTIPVRITNLGDARATFSLSVDPSSGGNGFLSRSTVTLAAGGHAAVTFTPTRDSAAPYDVHIIAKQGATEVAGDDLTVASVTFDPKIYNPDTPQEMVDHGAFRIPPRVGTPVPSFHITPALSDQVITVAVEGQSAAHGTVSINSGDAKTTVDLQSGPVTLTGVQQTEPARSLRTHGVNVSNVSAAAVHNPNALRLQLVIRVGGSDRKHDTLKSRGFAVTAIPQNMTETKITDLYRFTPSGEFIGLLVSSALESDSGNNADLGEVAVREVVEKSDANGLLAGATVPLTGGYVVATAINVTDEHSFPVSSIIAEHRLLGPGSYSGDMLTYQTHEFLDFRMGVVGIPMTNSGYQIERHIHISAGKLLLLTRKTGAAVTAKSISSDAGTITNPPAQSDQVIPGISVTAG
jgi:hypothetical protein